MTGEQELRILLIEDDAEDAVIFRRHADASTAYRIEVDHVTEAEQAWRRLSEEEYDLIFLDQRLGESSTGLDVLQRIRDAGPEPPVIVLTGTGDERDAVEMMKTGATDYLLKDTFNREVLERSIRYALQQHRLLVEREQAHQALRQSEERYRALTEQSLTGISIVGNGRLLYANPGFLHMLGHDSEDLTARPLLELVHPEDRTKAEQLLDAVMAGATVEQNELRLRANDGRTLWLCLSATHIDYQGRASVLLNATDVTEQRRFERQLLRTEKLTSIGRLVAGVAHELNNPLAAVLGYAELAKAKEKDVELVGYLGRICEQTLRASRIVGNLLTFARRKEPERKPLDLNSVVTAALDLRRHDLRASNIEVTLELTEDLPRSMGDRSQLMQVVLNLIRNAEDANSEAGGAGVIALRTSTFSMEGEPWVRFEVLDDGPGIPQEHLSRIFDPFFTTKEVGQGTGLGLSISYGIITSHQGFIYAENRPEGGTRLVVELPGAGGGQPSEPVVAVPFAETRRSMSGRLKEMGP